MILLTGFEPFGGEAINPSWLAAQQAAVLLNDGGLPATAVELPCVFGQAGEALREAIAATAPALVLAVGQAGGRRRISLERVAINVDDARIPDNAGNQPIDEAVIDGGPAAYFSTLPVKACLQDLVRAGVPAEVSQTAGTFVCNHLFYALMHQLAHSTERGARGGFIHVPFAAEQVAGQDVPSLEIEVMARALAIAARTSLLTGSDLKLGAGTTH